VQSELRIGKVGRSRLDPLFYAALIHSEVLGGLFGSRLNRVLREEKGYTYGASARLEVRRKESTMTAASSVKADVTDEALVDLLGVLKAAKSGERPITEEERIKSAGARRQDLVEAMSARDGVAGTYAELAALGLPADALAKGLVASQGQSAADINAALQGLDLDGALIVVVGDLKTIRADVEAKVPGAWTVVKP
jgi:zinc protease